LYIIGRAASFNTHEEFLSAILFSSISHSFVSDAEEVLLYGEDGAEERLMLLE
jgi:hypothetical protein